MRGFGLVEVLIACAILGAVGIVLGSLARSSVSTQKIVDHIQAASIAANELELCIATRPARLFTTGGMSYEYTIPEDPGAGGDPLGLYDGMEGPEGKPFRVKVTSVPIPRTDTAELFGIKVEVSWTEGARPVTLATILSR